MARKYQNMETQRLHDRNESEKKSSPRPSAKEAPDEQDGERARAADGRRGSRARARARSGSSAASTRTDTFTSPSITTRNRRPTTCIRHSAKNRRWAKRIARWASGAMGAPSIPTMAG